jgi:hypothetical protein
MTTNFNLTDLYDVNEIVEMGIDNIQDIIHDIFGYYEDIKKDAINEYLKAFAEIKKES